MFPSALLRWWATRHLRTGDLTALAAIAESGEKPKDVCFQRLSERRFVARESTGELAVTFRGRMALEIRRRATRW
jgi:hypothetical protein